MMTDKTPRVLVVDDEADLRELLVITLGRMKLDATAADSLGAARRLLDSDRFDLCLTDMNLGDGTGLDLLRHAAQTAPDMPVAVITAYGNMDVATDAMKLGAYDFIAKPVALDRLRQLIEDGLGISRAEKAGDGGEEEDTLVGQGPAMQRLKQQIRKLARSQAPIYISGESGSGKERVARLIHALGPRREKPFVAVNCGAIPHNLIENELFGHERGAFTDAVDQRIGRFETASGGTLLLDEIGELAPAVQVKLLRVLQEHRIDRLGSSVPIDVDIRILASTNRNLAADVESGRFRADLYYRINVVPIRMPALRERREDIRLLADRYLARAVEKAGRQAQLAPATLTAMETYSWPGNVRELENAIEHGLALCNHDTIEVTDLPEDIVRSGLTESLRDDWRAGRVSFEETVGRFERELLREALARSNGNQTRAASDLGITRRVLKLKLDRFGLDPSDKDEPLPRA